MERSRWLCLVYREMVLLAFTVLFLMVFLNNSTIIYSDRMTL